MFDCLSLPTRGRELKWLGHDQAAPGVLSLPTRGRELKYVRRWRNALRQRVAPHAGA